jgi:hypothetical protein
MPDQAKADILADAIDALLGIQPRKTAVTDPELRELLRIAGLRREGARRRSALAAQGRNILWQRLASQLPHLTQRP